jgi:hypothetical protein
VAQGEGPEFKLWYYKKKKKKKKGNHAEQEPWTGLLWLFI